MQNIIYSEKLKQVPSLYRLAQQATTYLDDLVSPWLVAIVYAEWNLTEDDGGRPVVTLSLREEGDEVRTSFTDKEFDNSHEVKSRLNDLWGDLLRIHTHTLLNKLLQSRAVMEE